jgi:hypothetical protein
MGSGKYIFVIDSILGPYSIPGIDFPPLNLSKNLAYDYSHPPSDNFGNFPRLLALGLDLSFIKV